MVIGGQPLNKRFVRYMVSFMGGHAGSRKIRRFLLPRSTNLHGRSPCFEGERNNYHTKGPDMSELTSRKRLNQTTKSIVLAVLCLCFANAAYAQEGICQYRDAVIGSEVYLFYGGRATLKSINQPVNGVVCSYSLSDKLVAETPYKNGKIEGVQKFYFEKSGKLEKEIPHKDGKQEGIERHYFENGTLMSETPYKDDKKEGVAKNYWIQGRLYRMTLYKNGEPISGTCADGRLLTNAELLNSEYGRTLTILCLDSLDK